jgi:hypothetical protein
MMAGAQAAGLEHAEIPEYLEQVVGAINEMKESLVDVNVNSLNKQLAMLGRLSPAMAQGGGARILSSVHKAFTSPGGGEWGQALMRSAMGFGAPGGQTGFYQAERMRQQGVNDPKNIPRLLDQLRKMFPNAEARAYAGSQALGLSMEQYDKLEQAVGKGEQEKISKIIEESKPIEEQALAAMKGVLGETKRQAALFEKGVVAGQIAAPIIEKLEDLSHDALLKILEYVKDIYDVISSWIGEKGGSEKANEAIKDATERLAGIGFAGSGKAGQSSFWKDVEKGIAKGYAGSAGEQTGATSGTRYFATTSKGLLDSLQKVSGYGKITPEASEYVTQGLKAVGASGTGAKISRESAAAVFSSYAAKAKTDEQKAAVEKFRQHYMSQTSRGPASFLDPTRVVDPRAARRATGMRGADAYEAAAIGVAPGEAANEITLHIKVDHMSDGQTVSADSTSKKVKPRSKKSGTSTVSTKAH